MSIWKLFRVDVQDESRLSSTDETESVRRIIAALDEMELERARFIAAFAYILSRVARSDQENQHRRDAAHGANRCRTGPSS